MRLVLFFALFGSQKRLVLLLFFGFFGLFLHAEEDFISRIRLAELQGDHAAVVQICQEWYESGQYSPGKLDWCYNALMSLEDHAILVTQNDHDTYSVWMLQNTFGIRQDVSVWSLPLLEQASYRKRFSGNPILQSVPEKEDVGTYIGHWLSQSGHFSDKPIYFSVLMDREKLKAAQSNLYLTGLAFKFSLQNFDNVTALRYNYEQRFRLDGLDQGWVKESNPENVAMLNLNYIPAFSMLHRHYKNGGELEKARRIEFRCMNIARAGNRESEVAALFYDPSSSRDNAFKSSISAKEMEKRMKKVNPTLFFGETEVTNAQYDQFLQDLLKNKAFGLLDTCKTEKTNWRALLPQAYKLMTDAEVFKHGHPDDPESPVENLSYVAAQQYCKWLTQAYTSDLGKKKYKKVLFRLPTKEEWKVAAMGGRKDVPYPWGGYFSRNSKGCYLGNFYSTESCEGCELKSDGSNDGGFFPLYANTYYPNDFGLYNMSGNVAEMVAEQGIAKGGSWEDLPHLCQTNAEKKYDKPSPAIGFRVVMEILEQ